MDNIIRKFNTDSRSEMHVVEFISDKRGDLDYNMDQGVFQTNPGNRTIITIKDNEVILESDVPKIGGKGKYNFSDFLCMAKFKSNFDSVLSWIKYDIYGEDLPFICVGTDYYKVITKFDRYNIPRTKLKLWKMSEIKPFYGKESMFKIPRYDDFCLEPNNIDYQPIIGNTYNQHSEFNHTPDFYGGDWKWTKQLLQHVFSSGGEDHFEEGMIYLQCLYKFPKRPLPILVLVSEERQTGKSTFIDWLSILFGENMVIANPEDIGSSFNSSYSDKNVIAIEESRFDSVQTTEKLKNLATQKKILVNAKHQQPYSLPFFGKLIITSNDERKFSKVDMGEIRYWVRKIPSLVGQANHNILEDMIEEIPYFLKYLLDREDPDFSKSRQVLEPSRISSAALDIVKEESRSQLYKDLWMIFEDIFNNSRDLKRLEFIAKDLKDKYFSHDSKVPASYIKKVLDGEFKLETGDNRRYDILDNGSLVNKKVGRAYTLDRSFFDTLDLQGEGKQINEQF